MRYRISPPPASPIARIVTAIVGIAVLAAALFFGVLVLLVTLGALGAFALLAWVRSRWPGATGSRLDRRPGPPPAKGRELDGEYTIVSRRRD